VVQTRKRGNEHEPAGWPNYGGKRGEKKKNGKLNSNEVEKEALFRVTRPEGVCQVRAPHRNEDDGWGIGKKKKKTKSLEKTTKAGRSEFGW